jgi:hypothetical protein
MTRPTRLRIAGIHHQRLVAHLFPGDGLEAVAIALCGRHVAREFDVLLVHEVVPVPHADCVRRRDLVTWRTECVEPLLHRARREGLSVVKFHSHPGGVTRFSPTDDASDVDFFQSVAGWVELEVPHASVVMLPDFSLFGRVVAAQEFFPLASIVVAGDDIGVFTPQSWTLIADHAERHAQLFGEATTRVLGQLAIGVVGCSGTGSFVVELLGRLGVRALVLVDQDHVEARNLNRIVGSTRADVDRHRLKVDVLADSVHAMGTGTRVVAIPERLESAQAVNGLAGCDAVFGCMDTHYGRRTLNRLADFYLLPYFDCGVGLTADGQGGIEEVVAASHYLQPGRSSLDDRGAINNRTADAEALRYGDPEEYERRMKEKYIVGAAVGSPAVAAVNALAAAMSVNELLARLHPYRSQGNSRFASVRFDLATVHATVDRELGQERTKNLGRGDIGPPLDMPELSVAVPK